jgi:quercetin dioxygenase-like cupin family protein
MLSFADFAPHAISPLHSHVEEQLLVALEGEFDGEVSILRPGDVAVILPGCEAGVTAGAEPSRILGIFSPRAERRR